MTLNEYKKNILQKESQVLSSTESGDRNQNLELLLNISKKISQSLILEDVLESVLKTAIDITNSERGFIVLKEKEGKLDFRLCLNSEGKTLPSTLFRISTTVVEDAFYTGQSVFIEGAQSKEQDPSKSIFSLNLQTILCTPLIVGKEKIGVIYVDSTCWQKITKKELTNTFELLAGQASIAIHNAQLYHGQLRAYSSLERVNRELEKAKEAAEKSDRLKTEFLRQMSHEVKTPINAIFGAAEILKDEMTEKLKEIPEDAFDMIDDAGNRIMRTIRDILEMSQLQTSNYQVNKIDIQLEDEIFAPLFQKYKPRAEKKSLGFSYENRSYENNIFGDLEMVRQIFSALLNNAIKYTDEGSIELIKYNNSDGQICVDVRDTGIGISNEYLPDLFTPFSQEDSGDSRSYEGNGLELAIIKRYIELNNAKINVVSQKGVGSTFTVTFPLLVTE
ncbi:ATP-binding protein [Bacteroidota bacterium]